MWRGQCGHVVRIVAVTAVDRNRVEGEGRRREVADDLDRVSGNRRGVVPQAVAVDDDLFDVIEKCNAVGIGCCRVAHGAGHDDFRSAGSEAGRDRFCCRENANGFGNVGFATDFERVCAGTAVDRVQAVADGPEDRVVVGVSVDYVIPATASQTVAAGATVQRVISVAAEQNVVTACTVEDISPAEAGECFVSGRSVENVGAGGAVHKPGLRLCLSKCECLPGECEVLDVGDLILIARRVLRDQDVSSCRDGQGEVGAWASEDRRIVARAAVDDVASRTAGQRISASSAQKYIVARAANELVCTIKTRRFRRCRQGHR